MKLFILGSLLMVSLSSFGQTIVDPVQIPYFVIKRKTSNVRLPESLGGNGVKGLAGITITVNSSGKLINMEIEKLKLSGKINLSYLLGQDVKNDTVIKYETFLQKCVAGLKIIKTDKRKPPETSRITFLVRF